LADGSESVFDIYEGTVFWDGQARRIPVHEAETMPLVGMSLFKDMSLRFRSNLAGTSRSDRRRRWEMANHRVEKNAAAAPLTRNVIAPGKAWRILRGESPRRARESHRPVSSLASVEESQGEQDRRSVDRESCRP